MFHFVYILRSVKDGGFYIGYTNDLKRRVMEHNRGENFSTNPRKPFELIYFEAYRNKLDAQNREKFFKSGWGRQHVQKVLKNFLVEKLRRG